VTVTTDKVNIKDKDNGKEKTKELYGRL